MSTTLASRYDPKEAQDRWYAFWEQSGYFHAEPPTEGRGLKVEGRGPDEAAGSKTSSGPQHSTLNPQPFSIVIPPPNVTGALHMGHALNNTLQDILIRWRRMQGYNTLWMPGTDHAGIATQAVVERRIREQEGLTRQQLGRDELVRRIWAWKDEYEKRILNQLRRLGCSCDWQRTRFTFDEGCSRAVRETFFKMFRDGLIYRGKRLVNWDTQLQTSVADDETYTEDVKSGFWTFKYPVKPDARVAGVESSSPQAAVDRDAGGSKTRPQAPEFVRFSTTRPETMLGDTAVAVHPNDPRYKHLIGMSVVIPIAGNREIPIIADGLLVDPELGTGCVKVTPAHDPNDYACGLRHKLPMINILNPDGTINDAGGKYAGLDRYKARDAVTADMEAIGLLDGREDRIVPLKFSDRSKSPIEPLLSDQWFVRMGERTPAGQQTLGTPVDVPGLISQPIGNEFHNYFDRQNEVVERKHTIGEREQSLGDRKQCIGDRKQFLDAASDALEQHANSLESMEDSLESIYDSVESIKSYEKSSFGGLAEGSESVQSGLDELAKQSVRDGGVAGDESAKPRQPGSSAEAGASQTQPQPPGLAEMAMQAVRDGRVKIHPERYAKTYLDWLGEKRDWCISRQLWWGHRIPVWSRTVSVPNDFDEFFKDGLNHIVDDTHGYGRLGATAQNFRVRTIRLSDQSIVTGGTLCSHRHEDSGEYRVEVCYVGERSEVEHGLEEGKFERDPDVLDTWFSSQLWPHSTLGWPERTRQSNTPLPALGERGRGEGSSSSPSGQPLTPTLSPQTWRGSKEAQARALNDPDWNQMKFFYPTSVLVTSRDIITLWVARMVIAGLYNCGDVPFRDVYITPKILDGFGQTMSKSKGNGVDPLDIIDKYGADALRFGIAMMTTDSQDARLPVGYECPFCQTHIAQKIEHQQMKPKVGLRREAGGLRNDENPLSDSPLNPQSSSLQPPASSLIKPRIKCPSCKKDFQFSSPNFDPDPGEPVARMVSERFEQGRNFANKLWNAARFVLMNLEDYSVEDVGSRELAVEEESANSGTIANCLLPTASILADEERWILSRLAETTDRVTGHLENFRFSEIAKTLYEFAWSEFCDWYVEMAKLRLKDPQTRPTAQRVLATVLDQLLRLLHPIMPFVTEHIWQALGEVAPVRGLSARGNSEPAAPSVMISDWPAAESSWRDPAIETRMTRLQDVIRAVRNIRSDYNVDQKARVAIHVKCPKPLAGELLAARPFVEQLASADSFVAGPDEIKPADAAAAVGTDWELYVPLTGLIDHAAEMDRKRKLLQSIETQLKGYQSKLANADFVAKAPPDVVELHRQREAELLAQKASAEAILRELGGTA